MAVSSDAGIRVYTTLSSNNADGFLKSIYDNPGILPVDCRVHDNPLIDLLKQALYITFKTENGKNAKRRTYSRRSDFFALQSSHRNLHVHPQEEARICRKIAR